jgi:hypothetical protein
MNYDTLFPNARDYPYVAEHKQWIRAEVAKRCRTLRRRYDTLLVEAIQIACRAEEHFDPTRGAAFTTVLFDKFRDLGRRTRWTQEADTKPERPLVDPKPARIDIEQDGIKVSGWLHAPSDLWRDAEDGRRLKKRLIDEIEPEIRSVIARGQRNSGPLKGYVRGLIVLRVRMERERLQEARNQAHGDFGTVIFDPRPPHIDLTVTGLPTEAELRAVEELRGMRGVSPSMRFILEWIAYPRGRTQRDLAEELDRTEQIISQMVRRARDLIHNHLKSRG